MVLFLFILNLWLGLTACFAENSPSAYRLEIKGAIGPATQDFFHRGLDKAVKDNASVFILQLDTPGGLSESMRGIVKDILESPIPVLTYVAPSGARAASAGTYILYASHIAAMAPGTNLGAATPVGFNETESPEQKNAPKTAKEMKAVNDAKAYLRSLAELRKRNAAWAELAVTQGASLSADQALQQKVIDFISSSVQELLAKANGRSVLIRGQPEVIHSQGLPVKTLTPDWRIKLLSTITDPNIAYILLMLGIYGLMFELMSPGFVMPGVVGAIALLLGLYALQLLPINYAGLALILLGVAFIISELMLPAFGAFGIGGVIAFLAGSILLFQPDEVGFALPMKLILAVTVVTAVFFFGVGALVLRSRRRPVVTGREAMLGKLGHVFIDRGQVWIDVEGERWQAVQDQDLQPGQQVKIIRVIGLKLLVRPFND